MRNIWLIVKREILSQLRSRGFQIGTGLLILMAFAGAFLPGLFLNDEGDDPAEAGDKVAVGVVGEASELADALSEYDVKEMADEQAARKAVGDGSVEAALVPDEESQPLGIVVIAKSEAPQDLIQQLTLTPAVELVDPPEISGLLRYVAAMVFAVVFFVVVVTFAQTAATNTVVEKQTRVIELLLSAVSARALLAGKILGNAALALATVAAIVVALVAGMIFGGSGAAIDRYQEDIGRALGESEGLLSMLAGPLIWFVVFFLVAFVMFSALMAGSAATVSRIEDVGSVLMPTMMLAMIPYFLVIGFQQNETVIEWLSFIPFSSPIAMPLRLLAGEVGVWQPLVALVILALTTWAAILLGARLYSNSILRTGARIKVLQAFRGAS